MKVRKVFGTETTDYLDGFQYTNSVLKFFPTAEGYFNVETGKYVYNYTDHLGNTRLSYSKKGLGTEIIEENNYYPFGLKHEGYNSLLGNSAYQYKYNGKELQETGMYAMDWRHYMPDIGRFAVQDALSALIPTLTPYRFAFNNPVYFSDPTGLLEETGNALATCPTCPNTKEFQPYINDPNNVYVYNPETNTAEKEIQIQEVVATGKKSDSGTLDYLNFLNDRAGDTSDILASRRGQGGSFRIFSNRNVSLQGFSPLYRADNFGARGLTRSRYYNVSKTLSKGSVIASVTLGAIEVGQGVADDYNDYQTKGETNGKNTAVATGSVAGGVAGGWAGAEAGAAVGAAIGVWFGGVGAAPGALVGGIIGGALGGWGGSELGKAGVEKAYE